MSVSSTQFLNNREEEYYRDRSIIEADRLEEERALWQWIDEEESKKKVKVPIQSRKITLLGTEDNNLKLEI